MLLKSSFYTSKSSLELAYALLGKLFIVKELHSFKEISGIINEVELYTQNDPSSHSFNGKTKRNHSMFKEAGHLYVYLSYGIHYCVNIVSDKENIGSGILLRSLVPFSGIKIMQKRRNYPKNIQDLTNGPGKIAQALAINKSYDGINITSKNSVVFLKDLKINILPKSIQKNSSYWYF